MSDGRLTYRSARLLAALTAVVGLILVGASGQASASRLIVDGGVLQVWTLSGPDLPPAPPPCDATHPGQGTDKTCLPPCDPDHPGKGTPPTCLPPCHPAASTGKPAPCREISGDDVAQDAGEVIEDIVTTPPDGAVDLDEATEVEVTESNPVTESPASQSGASVDGDDDPPATH